MSVACTCQLTSVPGEFPATYDQSTCPTHGPSAPRYFVDHGMIHDRVTGKHVEAVDACQRLNDLLVTGEAWKRRAEQHGCDVERGDPECG